MANGPAYMDKTVILGCLRVQLGVLHGEEYFELHRPLPSAARLRVQPRYIAIADKGRATTVVIERQLVDADSGDIVGLTETTAFIRGTGGWSSGGASASQQLSRWVYPFWPCMKLRVIVPLKWGRQEHASVQEASWCCSGQQASRSQARCCDAGEHL